MTEDSLQIFAEDFISLVKERALNSEDDYFYEDLFTEELIEMLLEQGEIEEGQVCHYKSRGAHLSGYGYDRVTGVVNLFVSQCFQTYPAANFTQKQFDDLATRALKGFERLRSKVKPEDVEESSPVFDMIMDLKSIDDITLIRLFVFTDTRSTVTHLPELSWGTVTVKADIWDIVRVFRSSPQDSVSPVKVDFTEFDQRVRVLKAESNSNVYECFVGLMPANVLTKIYAIYGPRLLERNVRSFLQARGKVNRGIRDTIINEPDMFLAYNNGITCTASSIETEKTEDGSLEIIEAEDFQIVNGGQTTASLYEGSSKRKESMNNVNVLMKITIIGEDKDFERIASNISRFSNTQNKIQMADFSSNDPFHVQIERMSRSIWAPAKDDNTYQTRWFYERSRGQYMDEKNRQKTRTSQKEFERLNPRSQRFTKTDLAKFENSWDQFPFLVSRGAQKNFVEFMLKYKEIVGYGIPDEIYFRHLIARAILFKETEKVVTGQLFGGYRANIVTYTISLLSYLSAKRLDLESIWRNQRLTEATRTNIESLSKIVFQTITCPSGGQNITEWCKKEACWDKLKNEAAAITETLEQELLEYGIHKTRNRNVETASPENNALIEEISKIDSSVWFEISSWAKETNNLEPWQRGIAYSIGRLLKRGRKPSIKQAKHGEIILAEAVRSGFTSQDLHSSK